MLVKKYIWSVCTIHFICIADYVANMNQQEGLYQQEGNTTIRHDTCGIKNFLKEKLKITVK